MPQRTAKLSNNLKGITGECPDKSLSHRSIIIPSISQGITEITNLLEGEDVMHTIDALHLAGVKIEKEKNKWLVYGKGLNSLIEPSRHLYLGNSGTSTRLLAGLFAPYNFNIFFTGDASLSKRPMQRLFKPLQQMGAQFISNSRSTTPFCMSGTSNLIPTEWEMKVPSAQVKSAILLAACQIQGKTTIVENIKTRDHTENMLKSVGAEIDIHNNKITINGGKQLKNQHVTIPNDPSSAAFLIATAILCENSNITVESVCINKTRIGFFDALIEMGAKIEFKNKRIVSDEEVADISAEYSPNLYPIHLNENIAPSMIDEYPIIFVVASFANGTSTFKGLHELTTKESNRLKIMEKNLTQIGVQCRANYENYSMEIIGNKNLNPESLQIVHTYMDHRIAMSCLIAGLRSTIGITIDDDTYINTSFPKFIDIMKNLGCNLN
jgi:3-phosphoshikimate 1-carboxyvinyltransferase